MILSNPTLPPPTQKPRDISLDEHILAEAEASTLSPEQVAFVADFLLKRNLLCTGNAGTGKTYLLNWLRKAVSISVTASTGIAAIQIGGSTVHSWAGIGIAAKTPHQVLENLLDRESKWNDRTRRRIIEARVLVIDEISMISAEFFELLEGVLSLVRCSAAGLPLGDLGPFGGLQVVVFGDFLQLPPVSKVGAAKFAFQSPVWQEGDFKVHLLTKTFRQADQRFADVLNKIRFDDLDEDVLEFLQSRWEAIDPDPDRSPCELHTHNSGCDLINLDRLSKLPGEAVTLPAIDFAKGKSEKLLKEIDDQCLAPAHLKLKVGARVMLLANLDVAGGLANGSTGTVLDIGTHVNVETGLKEPCVKVEFDRDGRVAEIGSFKWELIKGEEVTASRRQIPLRLAYAITIHKSQGMSLDKVRAHLGKVFEKGQSYVALSRARTPEGLFLSGTDITISAHPAAVQFYKDNA